MLFDTLKMKDRYLDAGFVDDQAEALVKGQQEGQAELATKTDLDNHRQATKTDLDNHRQATKTVLDNHRQATKTDLDNHRQATQIDLDNLSKTLHADLDNHRQATQTDLDNLSKTLHADLDNHEKATQTALENLKTELISEIKIETKKMGLSIIISLPVFLGLFLAIDAHFENERHTHPVANQVQLEDIHNLEQRLDRKMDLQFDQRMKQQQEILLAEIERLLNQKEHFSTQNESDISHQPQPAPQGVGQGISD